MTCPSYQSLRLALYAANDAARQAEVKTGDYWPYQVALWELQDHARKCPCVDRDLEEVFRERDSTPLSD